MIKHQARAPDQLYAETKLGIVTRYGEWFHITSDQIDEYAPGLLEKVSLDKLVGIAQSWIKSADSLSLILLLGLLVITNPWIAAGGTILFHGLWYFNKSGFVSIAVEKSLKLINTDGFMFISTLAVLSYLGIGEQYLAVVLGLILFFLLKLRLLKRIWDYIALKAGPLLLNDRVFKMVIIKYSLYEDVPPPEIKEMEERMKELAFSKKKK